MVPSNIMLPAVLFIVFLLWLQHSLVHERVAVVVSNVQAASKIGKKHPVALFRRLRVGTNIEATNLGQRSS